MDYLLFFLALFSFIFLIVGLVVPKLFNRFSKTGFNRKKVFLYFGSLFILCLIGIGIIANGTPTLDKITSLTNQKMITVSGKTSFKNSLVKIYLNGEVKAEINSNDEGIFSSQIELLEGENKIKASATNSKSRTLTSSETKVICDLTPPPLEIEQTPIETDQQEIAIKGKSEAKSEITIKKNIQEIKKEIIGKDEFELVIQLDEDDNKLEIVSTDNAGNTSETITLNIKKVTKISENTESVASTGNPTIEAFDYEIIYTFETRTDGGKSYLALIDPIDLSNDNFKTSIKKTIDKMVKEKGSKISVDILDDREALETDYKYYGPDMTKNPRTEDGRQMLAIHLVASFDGELGTNAHNNQLSFFPATFTDNPTVGKYVGNLEYNPQL